MDETQPNKTEAAAARRRRSSILKCQKANRTPFSELEFNVATPTDVTKSRRVSFSKRTGVAEYATNEATTTWKNFYEEHNKSVESSGNDSAANRQSVGHLGRRSYFDKQFQEDEALAVDMLNSRESFNTTNFADQIASLEHTSDVKNISAPHNQFNLSSFTEHQTKLFEDNLANSGFGEVTDKIDLNFSINPIKINEKDDLEEIQRDIQLQQASSNVICHGPIRDRKSVSEYIEIDELTITRATGNIEESDMSVTDTIQNPQVQNVSKSTSIKNSSIVGKISTNTDWVADKENIVVNPYIAPRESVNFVVNEEANQVLVFDGKRLTIQPESGPLITEPEVFENKAPLRKTIVLNLHDDLPNFVDDLCISRQLANKFDSTDSKIDMSNISFPQALPANVIIPDDNKRKTIVFDDGDISVTQALPAKVILPEEHKNKRQTIVFDDNAGDISMTQVVRGSIFPEVQFEPEFNHKNTVIYEDDADISMTQVLPSNIINTNKRRTIIYDNDDGNISLTQVVKCTDILAQGKTLENEDIYVDKNTSVIQAVDNVILSKTSKRTTIVFDNDTNDVSTTQVLPSNILLSVQNSNDNEVISNMTNIRDTIFCEEAYVSMTEVVPSDIAESVTPKINNISSDFDNIQDISMTQALPINIMEKKENKPHTIVFDDNLGDISVTQAISTNIIINQDSSNVNSDVQNRRKTVVFENKDGDISMTQVIQANILCNKTNESTQHNNYYNKVVIAELSKTQDVLDEINSIIDRKDDSIVSKNTKDLKTAKISYSNDLTNKSLCKNENTLNISKCEVDAFNQDALVYPAFIKFGKKHRKKSPVPVYTDDAESPAPDIVCSSSDLKSVPESGNTKTVLNELLNMSNASINIDNKENTTIPIHREPSKKSVTYEDSIGQSQFQINMELEKSEPIETNTIDQSEFQMDITLENKEESNVNTASKQLSTDIDNIESYSKSLDTNVEVINAETQAVVHKVSEFTATAVESKCDVESQHLTLDYKRDIEEKTKATVNTSFSTSNQNESKMDQSITICNKMETEPEDVIERKSEVTFMDAITEDRDVGTQMDLKKSFISENVGESDNDITFAPHRRLSKIPSRQSLAPSRDEFLNDITLAQQMLQTTKFELETSSLEDATVDCTLDDEVVPLNTESPVVKKLHFEDETFSDNSEPNLSAIKKGTYPEPDALENKAMVIPPFLQDINEDVKDLMRDLVKPMPDVMPFESNTESLTRTSTCSMQIQASLIASSQIEIASNESFNTLEATSSGRNKSVSFANNQSFSKACESRNDNVSTKPLIFDPNNPLNNVFITPLGLNEVHSYNPIKTDERSKGSKDTNERSMKSEDHATFVDNLLLISNPLDRSKVKNSEVNTTITVKENSELLRLHSSLTVIHDEQDYNTTTSENKESSESSTSLRSVNPYSKRHGELEADSSLTEPSNANSQVSDSNSNNSLNSVAPKAQKRMYSPDKQVSSTSNVEVTPKPSSKIMRHSSSPTITLVDGSLTSVQFDLEFQGVWANGTTHKDDIPKSTLQNDGQDKKVKKRIFSPQKHTGTTPKPTPKINKTIHSETKPSVKKSPRKLSPTKQYRNQSPRKLSPSKQLRNLSPRKQSTRNRSPTKQPSRKQSPVKSPVTDKPGTKLTVQRALVTYDKPKNTKGTSPKKIDYKPAIDMTSKITGKSITKTIASKIDRSPFMGDGACKWEACTREAWVFSLLKGHLRLCVNFARTKNHLVTDDTPVDSVTININKADSNDPIASLCLEFAADTMRAVIASKKHCTAVRVPQLLGRCAGIARLAAQWARAMNDAKTRLGFTLTTDGKLAFTVANLKLRSVYKLSIKISLADTDSISWPRASDVTVLTVVGDDVTEREVRAVTSSVSSGWGHVPVVAWQIFRHLKNKVKPNQMLSLV